ncbi:LysE family transporter [Erwinia tracheiphila]|uniref:Arginine transporter n=1 Tax=Erwinia tracheiphila TaxID=65700 RepID=A0A345CTU2_9GAMM|nr:LysE family transporter [Erwinia tracheiphila]AXF76859.1 arginine transporter [Erwinia tracheiphila]UIA84459.1 LysE family transporter [Erwinia tracheiphila]UIA93040.1 LysE family transporter [Erwinia tracheiphila]
MWAVYLQGMILSAALILPLGPQNVFVMNQGIRREHHLMTASLCGLSDIILMCCGIFGGGALLIKSTLVLKLVTLMGILFLFWYGWQNFRAALNGGDKFTPIQLTRNGRVQIIAALMAVTWLNPHVWIDTFVVLGSAGGQLPETMRTWFAFGAASASLLCFFSLALLATRLSSWIKAARVQCAIHFLVAAMMWWIAAKLALGYL